MSDYASFDNNVNCMAEKSWGLFLQLFIGVVQMEWNYMMKYTGDHPAKQRMLLKQKEQNQEMGVELTMDFKKSGSYWVFKNGERVDPNEFDETSQG